MQLQTLLQAIVLASIPVSATAAASPQEYPPHAGIRQQLYQLYDCIGNEEVQPFDLTPNECTSIPRLSRSARMEISHYPSCQVFYYTNAECTEGAVEAPEGECVSNFNGQFLRTVQIVCENYDPEE